MKIRHPLIVKSIGLVGSWVIRGWMRTLQRHFDLSRSGPIPADHTREPTIYACWHEAVLVTALYRGKVHVLISHHSDGELITKVCENFRIGVVRGSTTRGGIAAMMELIQVSKRSHLLLTPDGPRGPRRRVQPGIIYLASRAKIPIVPSGVGYSGCWRANSWDRFIIPKPFARVHVVSDTPIHVPADIDLHEIEAYRRHLESRLSWCTEAAERWANGGRRPEPTPATKFNVLPLAASA